MELVEHIAVFEGAVPQEACNAMIEHWETLDRMNLVHTRASLGDAHMGRKKDTTAFLLESETMRITVDQPFTEEVLARFWNCYAQYLDEYTYLRDTGEQWIRGMRLQKTLPGEGYHQWHYESDGRLKSDRATAWMIYLNDVESGGETEFLYQHHRVAPSQGTVVIWPAGYTHVHRGNPPLKGTKYILTGWCEW
jgi:hypothetical protein